MSVVALASAHGAPGVTTSAMALAWAWPLARPGRRVLLVDADPAGSGLLTGPLRAGVPDSTGVSVLAAVHPPLTGEQVIGCTVALDEHSTRMVLPGVVDPVQARPLGTTWTALVDVARDLSAYGVDVLVDVGRVGHRYEPTGWLSEADLLLLVVRGNLPSVLPAAAAVRTLASTRAGRSAPVGLVVDPGPYSTDEIAGALGLRETVTLPPDEWVARALLDGSGRGVRFERSSLLRAARAIVNRLTELVPEPQPVTR